MAGRILGGVFDLRPSSANQFGVLCLILTPIARVAYSLFSSTAEGHRRQMFFLAILLATLISAFLSAAAGGA